MSEAKKKKTIEERAENAGEAIEKGAKKEIEKSEKALKTGAKKASGAARAFEKGVKEGIEEEKKRIRGEKERLP